MMRQATILLVDDEPGFLQILQIVLKRSGYRTLTASNAYEAQALLKRETPDAIILDDNMPQLSGAEWCYQLKQDPQTQHIPVIMYSAGTRVENSDFIRHIGADGVLQKPCMPNDILTALDKVLNAPAHV